LTVWTVCIFVGALGACSGGHSGEKTGEARAGLDPNDLSCPGSYRDTAGTVFSPDLSASDAPNTHDTIPGHFDVSDDGSATYTILIDVLPGRTGMQPEIGIAYNSDSGNGLLGVGFSLTGFSSITYCPKNVSDDGKLQAIQLDGHDPLCLDGKRLVAVNGTYGAIGTEYRTVPDTFVRVASMPTCSNPEFGCPGQQKFRVWTKNGRIHDYGGDYTPVGWAVQTVWNRTRIADRSGNAILFDYGYVLQSDTRAPAVVEQWIDRVEYTWHDNPSLGTQRAVVFDYDQNRPDPIRGYDLGIPNQTTRRLKAIRLMGPGPSGPASKLVRGYVLKYEIGKASGRSRLKSIQDCVPTPTNPTNVEGICKNPTTFNWARPGGDAADPGVLGFTSFKTSAFVPASSSTVREKIRFDVGDFNGDGRDDLLFQDYDAYNYIVSLAEDDPTLNESSFLKMQSAAGLQSPTFESYIPVDYNQDGRTDLFRVTTNTYKVYLANGSDTTVDSTPIDTGIPAAGHPEYVHFVDFNGDGAPDLLTCQGHPAYQVRLWLPPSQGGPGYGPPISLGPAAIECQFTSTIMTMDANGDGAADVLISNGADNYTLYFGMANPTDTTIVSVDSGIPTSGLFTDLPPLWWTG